MKWNIEMTIFSILFLIFIAAAFVYIKRVETDVKQRIRAKNGKSEYYIGSLIEQTKALQLAKFSLVGIALLILSLALIKQIIITVIIFFMTFLILGLSTKRFNLAKQLSRIDASRKI